MQPRSPMMLLRHFVLLVSASLVVAGCSKNPPEMPDPGPVRVQAMMVTPTDATRFAEKVGEVRGSREINLRARISGILLKQHVADGMLVKEGELLFTLDAREYRAQAASAAARVASAEANLARARQDVARYAPLLADEAISQQVYDNAATAASQAEAEVLAQKAALAETRLGLEYAEVRSPVTGRMGAATVYPGDLVAAGQTVLATVSRDDPAWVNFAISEGELLALGQRLDIQNLAADDPARMVRLILADGSLYPAEGRVTFVDRALNASTGTFTLRAEFPNPDHALLPGLFARVRVNAGDQKAALMVPDRAVQEVLGRYFVTVIGDDQKVLTRPVEPGVRLGNRWVINQGLSTGDRVVIEGLQKAPPGTQVEVTLVTWDDYLAPEKPEAAPAAPDAR